MLRFPPGPTGASGRIRRLADCQAAADPQQRLSSPPPPRRVEVGSSVVPLYSAFAASLQLVGLVVQLTAGYCCFCQGRKRSSAPCSALLSPLWKES